MIGIFNFINQFTGNYGWTIVIFTILFRLVLSPLDIRSRIGQREYTAKMAKIQPEIDQINKAYRDDPNKAAAKTMELRKKEGIGMLPKGCGTMLLTYPILIAFFAVFRNMAAYQIIGDTSMGIVGLANIAGDPTAVSQWFDANGFLWIKNIWQPDAAFSLGSIPIIKVIPIFNNTVATIIPQGDYIATVLSALSKLFTNGFTLADAVAQVTPALNELAKVFTGPNGYFILPVFAGLSQYISIKLTPTNNQTQSGPQAEQAAKTSKFMTNFFPILFVYFCLISSSALAIYWITSNICMLILNLGVNKYLDIRDARKAALDKGV